MCCLDMNDDVLSVNRGLTLPEAAAGRLVQHCHGRHTKPSAAADMHKGVCTWRVFKYCTEEMNRMYHIVGIAWRKEGSRGSLGWMQRKGNLLARYVASCCTFFPMCLGVCIKADITLVPHYWLEGTWGDVTRLPPWPTWIKVGRGGGWGLLEGCTSILILLHWIFQRMMAVPCGKYFFHWYECRWK